MQKSSVYFLERNSLYLSEKPYSLRFEFTAAVPLPRTNVLREPHDIALYDLRPCKVDFRIDKQGFAVVDLSSVLRYEDYSNNDKVKDVYYKEAEAAISNLLPKSKWARVIEHTASSVIPLYAHFDLSCSSRWLGAEATSAVPKIYRPGLRVQSTNTNGPHWWVNRAQNLDLVVLILVDCTAEFAKEQLEKFSSEQGLPSKGRYMIVK